MSDLAADRAPVAAEAAAPASAPAARPRRGRLFRKYALSFAGLVGVMLLASGAVDGWFSYRETRDTLAAVQQAKAEAASQRIEQFIAEIERQIGWTTHAQWAANSVDIRRFDYVRLLRQVPAITELVQIDGQGREQLKVSRLAMDVVGGGTDYAADPRFTEARARKTWHGPVYFRKESEPYMTIAVVRQGREGGVTLAEINLKLIWDPITAMRVGRGGYVYVVDRDGRLIAHPDISLVLRNTDLSASPQVAAARAAGPQAIGDAPRAEVVPGFDGRQVFSAWATIPQLGWTVFVEAPVREALDPLFSSLQRTLLLLALGLAAAAAGGVLFARRMLTPIRALEAGAARMGAGELDHRIDVRTGDELQALADGFNAMGGRLSESYATLERKVEERTAELSESLERQTATSEVLNVISRSTSQLQPVLDAIVRVAAKLCHARALVFLKRGEFCHVAAAEGVQPDFLDYLREHPIPPAKDTLVGRTALEKRTVYIRDAFNDPTYTWTEAAQRGGYRSNLGVPLMRGDEVVGVIALIDPNVRGFTDKQVELLEGFANQAVIAIENVRLFDEVQARTAELQESLERQTATSEVLKAISRSTFDLGAVLDALTAAAKRLCKADFAWFARRDGDTFRVEARELAGPVRDLAQATVRLGLDGGTLMGRTIQQRQVAQIVNPSIEPGYPLAAEVRAAGVQSILGVPMLRDGAVTGVFMLLRQRAEAFTSPQIDLVSQFADQAVIAIENVRLFDEVQARTRQLTQALEHQTATNSVLEIISRSPRSLEPVFEAMLENATRICEAQYGIVSHYRDGAFRPQAMHNVPPDYAAELSSEPEYLRAIAPESAFGRMMATRAPVQIEDVTRDYAAISSPIRKALIELGKARTFLAVPILKEGTLIGAFGLYRQDVRAFTPEQIDLVSGFANQAVIAIENVRLFDEVQTRTAELQQSLERQTATSEVLKAISRSTFDLTAVLEALTAAALRLCRADYAWFARRDGDEFRFEAGEVAGPMRQIVEKGGRFGFDRGTVVGRAALGRAPVQVIDVLADPEYRLKAETSAVAGGPRTVLGVPLLRDGEVIGVFALSRSRVEAFEAPLVDLVSQFADQAVIAMENVRLFDEVQARTAEVQQALDYQTATSEVLETISRSPTDAQPVFDAIVRNAVTLCGSSYASVFRLDGEMLHFITSHNVGPKFRELVRTKYPMRPDRSQISGRVILSNSIVTLEDSRGDPEYDLRFADQHGWRRLLGVPIRREGKPIGTIVVGWTDPGPVPERQVDLMRTFADQAVIAIENVRLFDEVQARTRELQQTLEHQTATNAVLEIISRSPRSLDPVFEAMLENATRICEAQYGIVFHYRDGAFHPQAMRNVPPAFAADLSSEPDYLRHVAPESAFGRMMATREPIQVEDVTKDYAYEIASPIRVSLVELGKARTFLAVPILREGTLIGAFGLYRQEVRLFTPEQIELVAGFANQAVIAIENVRLFDEVQARTAELQESLEQQTATSEVLRVITSSPGELGPVFESVLANATRICDASFGSLFLHRDGQLHMVAMRNMPADYAAFVGAHPQPVGETRTSMGRAAATRAPVMIEDLSAGEAYREGLAITRVAVERGGVRTILSVPMLKENELVGVFVIYRREVRPFTPKQIELASSFANQAAVAIENVRLLNETREALERQTATSEILTSISGSMTDTQPVFDAIVRNLQRLIGTRFAVVQLLRDGMIEMPAAGGDSGFERLAERYPRPLDDSTFGGQVMLSGEVLQLSPVIDNPLTPSGPREFARDFGFDSVLFAPMTRGGKVIGAIGAADRDPRRFDDKQVALIKTFADQAVIAIENVRLFDEVQARTRELQESLEQQTATSEVLQVITRSPGELSPVFDAILHNASKICDAPFGALFRARDGALHIEAMLNIPPVYADYLQTHPQPLSEIRTGIGRVMATKQPVLVVDAAAEEAYRNRVPLRVAAVELGGIGTFLAVPMLKEDELVGMFVIYRTEVRTFSPKQIELATSFASQAAVAIENVRLLNEVQARTAELQESLEQQTATSEVLKVITGSPGELEPVFESALENATRICDATFGALYLPRDGAMHLVAQRSMRPMHADFATKNPQPLSEQRLAIGQAAATRKPVMIEDLADSDAYRGGAPHARVGVDVGGARTILAVPMLKENELVGMFVIYRTEVRPFTPKQIELASSFASQAAVAIENVRLLNEVQARTAELQQSLEYQTATSDVLKAISRSTFDLSAVLNALTAAAMRLCQADFSWFFHREGDRFRVEAGELAGAARTLAEDVAAMGLSRGTLVGRTALERRIVHIVDALADPEYSFKAGADAANVRTLLGVPLIRDGTLLGVFSLGRNRVEPFSAAQIELVTAFADQAVIAMENVRLFEEVQARTRELGQSVEELRALGDVSQTVNSTLDAPTVLQTIVAKSVGLSGTDAGAIYVWSTRHQAFRMRASAGGDESLDAAMRKQKLGIDTPLLGDAARRREVVQAPELREVPESGAGRLLLEAGYRALLVVPLIGPERAIGALVLRRKQPGAFAQRTVDLMRTFAAQSVVAIQNARLFGEIEEKGRELALASQHKSQFLANMSHELRTPLNAVLGYAELMADGVYGDLTEKAAGVLGRIQSNGKHLLGLINDVLDLSKIEAGQLTLALDDYALPGVVQSVVAATESLASNKGLKLGSEVAPGLPLGRGDERRLTQVLLNVVGNAIKFTDQGGVTIAARLIDTGFEVAVTDTGPGIAPEHQARIFEEFQQVDDSSTRKKGGSGLGLAISRKIVEMHGGTIAVESAVGAGSTFRIRVPVRVEAQREVA